MSERIELPPDDAHNRALVANVHPGDWVNPEPKKRYHLVVVGAGTAGLVAAAGAAGLGAKVALVEKHLMGGDCLNFGCVPSKALIAAARSWHGARGSKERFGGPAVKDEGDFAAVMERLRRLRAQLSPVDGARRFQELGVDVFLGEGKFLGGDEVEAAGRRLKFRRAVIATGARAAAPPVPGLQESGYLTNETIFSLTALPERLSVVGAGPIGCELAQAFARLGSRVSVIDAAERVLPREDADAAALVQAALERDGVRYIPGAKITGAAKTAEGRVLEYEKDGEAHSLVGDEILVAVGRVPNVEALGLERAGVAFDYSGVQVDDRLRTTNKKIFAVGDVASAQKFTHSADFQARLVLANALFFARQKSSALIIPRVTYTSPELAHVGLSEAEAVRAGFAVQSLSVEMKDVDRAVLEGETEGFLRVHLKKGTDSVLGATLVAARAGDLIGEAALAITAGIGLSQIGKTVYPYPTQGEIFRKAADAYSRTRLTPRVKKLFSWWFRIFS